MNAHVRPSHVLGIYKSQGQPVQLVNAFENPVRPNGDGWVAASKQFMTEELAKMKSTWDMKTDVEISIPQVGIEEFIKTLASHVS